MSMRTYCIYLNTTQHLFPENYPSRIGVCVLRKESDRMLEWKQGAVLGTGCREQGWGPVINITSPSPCCRANSNRFNPLTAVSQSARGRGVMLMNGHCSCSRQPEI